MKVARIAAAIKNRPPGAALSLRKKEVSHEVPKPGDLRRYDHKVDISDLNDILSIDPEARLCAAEPGVAFAKLVRETLKHGLVPLVTPEFRGITLGGAVAGCSIESMSFACGGFHDTCLEYEVVTGKGEVLACTPDNENSLVFQMVHGTFGTLGIITKLVFRLLPAKKYVRVTYKKYESLAGYKAAILDVFEGRSADFMDGIIFSAKEYILCLGRFVDKAPYVNRYAWLKVYYVSTARRREDYLKTEDYFFRYDQGVTNVGPKSFLGRLFLGWLFSSSVKLRIARALGSRLPRRAVPVTVDLFIPFSRAEGFFSWYNREIGFYPLWCVPYRHVRDYEWIGRDLMASLQEPLYLDLAIYGLKKDGEKNHHRMLERKLMDIGGLKTLISENFYTEEEFWSLWNKENYDAVKKITDPDNVFRNLYEKTCRTMQGREG